MRAGLAGALLLAAGSGHAAEPPRLTGTLIGPGGRTALFAAGTGGTIPATVGEAVGDYVVGGIEPGRVQLDKAGQHVVVTLEAPPAATARDRGSVTFGLVLRQPGPADD